MLKVNDTIEIVYNESIPSIMCYNMLQDALGSRYRAAATYPNDFTITTLKSESISIDINVNNPVRMEGARFSS